MFSSRITDTVTIQAPELGEASTVIVTIRKLADHSLEKANEARQIDIAKMAATMGDSLDSYRKVVKEASAVAEAEKAVKAEVPVINSRDRHQAFDRDLVLQQGILRWSCEDLVPLTPDAIKDLDQETAVELWNRILDLSLPPVDVKKQEEVQRKD